MSDPFRSAITAGRVVGGRIEWDEGQLTELLRSEHGPLGRYFAGVVGPAVTQEAKRRAPVSPDGSHGRPSGYLRSNIGHKTGVDVHGLHVDIEATAKTPDGVDYSLIVEVGSAPHVIESHGDYPLRDKHGNVFGRRVNHPGTKPANYLRGSLSIVR